MDYERLNRERAALDAYLARERALLMAQRDWHKGVINEDRVIAKASQYEAYLTGRPVCVTPEQDSINRRQRRMDEALVAGSLRIIAGRLQLPRGRSAASE